MRNQQENKAGARLHAWLFRLAYALAGAAFLAALLPLLWQARFEDAVRLTLPFAAGFYVTASLMYARYRATTVRVRRRSLHAAERAMQAFLLLSMGVVSLFACGVFLHGLADAVAGSAWLVPVCMLPMYFVLRAYASLYRALDAWSDRYFGPASLRAFTRDMR